MKLKLLLSGIIATGLFTAFSYTVAREYWQKIDFDTTVKLQDHISRRFDEDFSIFSLLGSIEVTVGLCVLMMALSILNRSFASFLGWSMIIPASMAEVFGKLVLFHPSPPVLFHRTLLPSNLPQFYIHTNFSYPSGHMTRTIFIATVLVLLLLLTKMHIFLRLSLITAILIFSFMMGLTRVYLGEHWLSDVSGGAILGIAMGFFATLLILFPKRGIKRATA